MAFGEKAVRIFNALVISNEFCDDRKIEELALLPRFKTQGILNKLVLHHFVVMQEVPRGQHSL